MEFEAARKKIISALEVLWDSGCLTRANAITTAHGILAEMGMDGAKANIKSYGEREFDVIFEGEIREDSQKATKVSKPKRKRSR